ncbi:deoxyguanosinetriphosphate triphosphohydrolase [Prolixibacteraceae bacterium JC049]|nr:deoxyguanosinetriphosphate triphosphohydrolase [Prolixibacteraceae bacterium JC049]
MNWHQLLSTKRLGLEDRTKKSAAEERSEFQRDYDRLIFSSPFRRLQNKTQVFPLPGSVFVHNRLTHSLEVASVGRSLGNNLSHKLDESGEANDLHLVHELGAVVSTACLAHDLGNPPFGHSGEDALSEFFSEGKGLQYKELMTAEEWCDLSNFEGNANALRLLSHQFGGRRNGGFALTYTTLASIVKYPFESVVKGGKKYGFFQSEKELYIRIAKELGLKQKSSNPIEYCRHPLVYLVEAADDICYQVMDIEDAHKLHILTTEETKQLYMNFFQENDSACQSIERNLKIVTDKNEQVAYLRAMVIGKLVHECTDIFWENRAAILNGEFESTLIKSLNASSTKAMKAIKSISIERIYNDPKVVQIEVAGYKVLGTLLEEFTHAVMHPKQNYSKKLISMMPQQYITETESAYLRLQSVLDFLSGMTDVYALELYRKLKGITLPEI